MDYVFCGEGSQSYNGRDFKQLFPGEEFYETTLPYKKIVPDKNNIADTFLVFYNQTYISAKSNDDKSDIEGVIQRAKLTDIENEKSFEGSGSNYLSNEIFYRLAKIRTEMNVTLQTGHLHLPLIQATQNIIEYFIDEGYRNSNLITVDHSPYIKSLIDNISQNIKKL